MNLTLYNHSVSSFIYIFFNFLSTVCNFQPTISVHVLLDIHLGILFFGMIVTDVFLISVFL